MPTLYQMIGLPGAGKSYYIENHPVLSKLPVISTDYFVEEYSAKVGKTYSEVFHEYMDEAVRLMMVKVKKLRQEGQDCVWDQTSTTINTRRKKFNAFPGYRHIAVWITTPSLEIHNKRLQSRPGKIIPQSVIEDMTTYFQAPSLEEGFDDIWVIKS